MTDGVKIETSARLAIIESAGLAVATIVEGVERDELLRSRLTRAEVTRQLQRIADAAAGLAPAMHDAMREIDWDGWRLVGERLALTPGEALDEALWFGCESLVPATLLWLRVHRQSHGALFRMTD